MYYEREGLYGRVMKVFVGTAIVILSVALLLICLVFEQPLELIAKNAIITPVAFVAAAFANATAVGGGFLFVPLFIYVYGLAPVVALKLALATQAFGMSSGAIGWGRDSIVKSALLIGAAASLLGFWAGSYAWQVPSESIKPLFGGVSIFIFVMVILEIKFGNTALGSAADFGMDYKGIGYLLITFCGGMITAWTAIAVGEFVAVYLLFVYRVRIEMAIATGVAILAINSVAGLFFHMHSGGIRWDMLAFTAPGVLLGGFCGARVGRHVEHQISKIADTNQDKYIFFTNSPLKLLFVAIILVDGTSILVNTYFFG